MKNNYKGFTLIELLVVVLIIGILAAIALPQYIRVKEKTIMTEGMKLAKQIADANQRYYLVNGEYSDDIQNLDIEFIGNLIGKRIETNNFVVSATGSFNEIAVAQKKPFPERYYIRILPSNPNIFNCGAYSTASQIQKELCNKLNADGYL